MAREIGVLTLRNTVTGDRVQLEMVDSTARDRLNSKISQGDIGVVSLTMLDSELRKRLDTSFTIDVVMSDISTNPVQNKVIKAALDKKSNTSHSHIEATTEKSGYMSASDKAKLDKIDVDALTKLYERVRALESKTS